MRIFVTGASGFIGSAVVADLNKAGHEVLGLARSDAAARTLEALGAEAHRGNLEDPDSLRSGASACDGVLHLGFIHDFSKFEHSCAVEKRVVETLGAAVAGSGKPLVITSGTALVSPGRLATEDMPRDSGPNAFPRVVSEDEASRAAERGGRAMVVRLPPSVHGDGDHGFVPMLINTAREKGVSAYVGDGRNRWPATHRLDAATVYRLAVERGAAGARYHPVADEGVPFKDIAEVIGRRLGIPVDGKTAAEAAEHFGWLAHFVALDAPASSARTRELLGWQPSHPGLIEDLERSAIYFRG